MEEVYWPMTVTFNFKNNDEAEMAAALILLTAGKREAARKRALKATEPK